MNLEHIPCCLYFRFVFFSEISSISGVPKSNVRALSPCNLIALHVLHKNRLSNRRSPFDVQIYGLVAHYLTRTSRIAGLPMRPNYLQVSVFHDNRDTK